MSDRVDRRDALAAEPFSYREVAGGRVLFYWHGRHVKTLTGAAAARFADEADGLAGSDAQLLMAKVTGNFKRGNERL